MACDPDGGEHIVEAPPLHVVVLDAEVGDASATRELAVLRVVVPDHDACVRRRAQTRERELEHRRVGLVEHHLFADDERVEPFTIPSIPVSSSEIRERVQRGESIDGLVPPRVARLIAELGLYRDPQPGA